MIVPGTAQAATNSTISTSNKWAWAANSGWINCLADTTNGMVLGEFVCSGYLWSSNVGWICLGNGSPTNGIRYTNVSSNDYGVNHDGAGSLRGYAWSESVGWINFENTGAPKVDLKSGVFSGCAWGGSMGWITFTNIQAFSQTTNIMTGIDSDFDGIPDQFELAHTGSLTNLGNVDNPDSDGDGMTDLEEYRAGTDPTNPNSCLELSNIRITGANVILTWSAGTTRVYKVETRTNMLTGSWVTNGVDLVFSGTNATATLSTGSYSGLFYRIKAAMPFTMP